jgi:hypothetical protein
MTQAHCRAVELILPRPIASIVVKYALSPDEILPLVLAQGSEVMFMVKAHPSFCNRGEHRVTIIMQNTTIVVSIYEPQTDSRTCYHFGSINEFWEWINTPFYGGQVVVGHAAFTDLRVGLLNALAKY